MTQPTLLDTVKIAGDRGNHNKEERKQNTIEKGNSTQIREDRGTSPVDGQGCTDLELNSI